MPQTLNGKRLTPAEHRQWKAVKETTGSGTVERDIFKKTKEQLVDHIMACYGCISDLQATQDALCNILARSNTMGLTASHWAVVGEMLAEFNNSEYESVDDIRAACNAEIRRSSNYPPTEDLL